MRGSLSATYPFNQLLVAGWWGMARKLPSVLTIGLIVKAIISISFARKKRQSPINQLPLSLLYSIETPPTVKQGVGDNSQGDAGGRCFAITMPDGVVAGTIVTQTTDEPSTLVIVEDEMDAVLVHQIAVSVVARLVVKARALVEN